ncbi:MAG TPA: hypothetical protein VL128_10930 [Candidatus Eisenbacteria bacterium]|nr:hypothetical protein [Candidatus Eisenbacteria bacterium]
MSSIGQISRVNGDASRLGAVLEVATARALQVSAPASIAFPVECKPKTPWWLWWNLLSLDAPTVAAVWAIIFAKVAGRVPGIFELGALALAVWLIYVTDRLLDGWCLRDASSLQERHRLCMRHRAMLCALGIAALCAGTYIATMRLNVRENEAGFAIGALVGAYLLCIHAGGARLARLLPKEFVVGVLFAAGATLPIWSKEDTLPVELGLLFALFGLLCALNCTAIECWENKSLSEYQLRETNPAVAWAQPRLSGIAAGIAVVSLVGLARFGIHGGPEFPWVAMFLSSATIFVLHGSRERFTAEGLRVLADAALVVPPLLVLLWRA